MSNKITKIIKSNKINKIIKINRGDSYSFPVVIPDKNNPALDYRLKPGEALYFALMYPHQRFEDALLYKGYDHSDYDQDDETNCELSVNIEPKDTRCLTPGVYYYTVKYQKGGTLNDPTDYDDAEEVRTIIERTKFIINE